MKIRGITYPFLVLKKRTSTTPYSIIYKIYKREGSIFYSDVSMIYGYKFNFLYKEHLITVSQITNPSYVNIDDINNRMKRKIIEELFKEK